jgi:hypothetical protein
LKRKLLEAKKKLKIGVNDDKMIGFIVMLNKARIERVRV